MKIQIIKRMAILTIVSTVIINGIFAQPGQNQPPSPPPIPDVSQIAQMVDELTQNLSLSDEQTEQMLSLYTTHFTEAHSKMEGTRPDPSKMDNRRKEFEEKVKALLTDEQQIKYDELLQSRRPPQRGPRR